MTDLIPLPALLGALGLASGFSLGAAVRLTRFCTACAIRGAILDNDLGHARMLALTIAVAIAGTQSLHLAGIVDLQNSTYWYSDLNWFGPVIGGLVFGVGMAMLGTCAFTTLTNFAGGDLRGLCAMLVIGIAGYATTRGLLAIPHRVAVDSTTLPLGKEAGPDFASLLSNLTGADLRLPLAALLVALLAGWAYRDRTFRRDIPLQLGALTVGAVVTFGWFATGVLGADPLDPQPVESIGYISPISNTLVYAMTSTGATLNFGIGVVVGTVAGAAAAALVRRDMRLQSYTNAREMRRHLIGAALMGTGGIAAMGCTIGQGITGFSTLSLGSLLSFGSIWVGAVVTMRLLAGGPKVTAQTPSGG